MTAAIDAALKAGKHVLSEKPFAPSIVDSIRLWTTYRTQNLSTWCVLENWARKPAVDKIIATLENGELGDVLSYALRFHNDEGSQRQQPLGWRGEQEWDGGWCLDIGVHFVRAVRRCFGEIVEVRRDFGVVLPERGHPHEALAGIFEHENGLLGRVCMDQCVSPETLSMHLSWNGLLIFGKSANLEWRFNTNSIDVVSTAGPIDQEPRCGAVEGDGWIQGGVRQTLLDGLRHCASFAGLLRKGTGAEDHKCSAEEALRDAAAIWSLAQLHEGECKSLALKPAELLLRAGLPEDWFVLPSSTVVDATGSRCYKPSKVCRCISVKDVQVAVCGAATRAEHTRAVGTDHSWARYGETDGLRIDMRSMARLVRVVVTGDGRTIVVVQAGMLIKQLVRLLAARGLCLRSPPVLLEQTVGGGCATGTHGSSMHHGTLSDDVVGLRLVDPNGESRWLGAYGEVEANGCVLEATCELSAKDLPEVTLLRAARLSRGELGVVVEVAFHTVALYRIQRQFVWGSDAEMLCKKEVERLHEGAAHMMLHWLPAEGRVVAVRLEQVDTVKGKHSDARDHATLGDDFVGRSWFPVDGLPVDEIHDSGKKGAWRSMEYCAPLGRLAQGACAVRRLGAWPQRIEVKFLQGRDTTLIGPNAIDSGLACAARSSVEKPEVFFCFNLWWFSDAGSENQNGSFEEKFEKTMREEVCARPHWGKAHTVDACYVDSVLPGAVSFRQIVQAAQCARGP
eukprot:TRINITY_DN21903_c0_g1_i1.p1 TRINITY_DN21903_c0_g1~~TRINITY_DN21903_c0_g1_i1.p1  ORF type:complete len:853 (-),score=134.15 TRINITY_DN21903_c0_g1_i1:50-2254(-)